METVATLSEIEEVCPDVLDDDGNPVVSALEAVGAFAAVETAIGDDEMAVEPLQGTVSDE